MVIIKTIAGQTVEHAVGLDRIDMDKFRTFPVPVTVFGTQRLTAAFGHGTVTLRHLFRVRGQILAERDGQQNKQENRTQYQPAHLQRGHTGSPNHRQFTTVGKQAQANQGAQQDRHRQVFVHPARRCRKDKLQSLHGLVIAAQAFQFIDKAEQTIKANDNAQDGQCGYQHRPPEVASQ